MPRCDSLLVACAMPREVAALRRSGLQDYQYLVTGIGMKRTRKVLRRKLARHRPDVLIFTGIGGQLQPEIAMGDIVFPDFWCNEQGQCRPNGKKPQWLQQYRRQGLLISGRGLTVNWPVFRRRQRIELFRRHQARICDMEAAAVLEVAADMNLPKCWAFKVVADTAASGWLRSLPHFRSNMRKLADFLAVVLKDIRDT